MYDFINLRKKCVNWPSNLASHNRILNEESKEELGWKSPFEVYFDRKSNILVKASLENVADLNDCIIKAPKRKDYRRHFRNAKKLQKTAQLYSKRMNERMVVYNPNGDGNCQFEACRFWLQTLGIYHSVEAVREENSPMPHSEPRQCSWHSISTFCSNAMGSLSCEHGSGR